MHILTYILSLYLTSYSTISGKSNFFISCWWILLIFLETETLGLCYILSLCYNWFSLIDWNNCLLDYLLQDRIVKHVCLDFWYHCYTPSSLWNNFLAKQIPEIELKLVLYRSYQAKVIYPVKVSEIILLLLLLAWQNLKGVRQKLS